MFTFKRILTGVAGAVLVGVGIRAGNGEVIGAGAGLLGWAVPWTNDARLWGAARALFNRGATRATPIEDAPHLSETEREALRRLRRVSSAPEGGER